MKTNKVLGLLVVMCAFWISNTALAGWPTGMIGAQIRRASPGASQALLAVTRSIPPQVKNQMPLYNTYPWGNGGRNAWQAAGGGRSYYAPPPVRQQRGVPQQVYAPVQTFAPAPPARISPSQQQLQGAVGRGSESFGLSTASPPPPNRIVPRAANNR